MENGLIIGRNYWNKEIRCTERYGNNNPMQDNEIGQQSEKIWDKRVSRIHLLLTESDNHNYPYRLKLLNTNNVVYVNGVPITEILIKGDEKVELGCDEEGNHYIRVKGVRWFTNLEHGKRHHPLDLMTMEDNLMFSRHKEIKGKEYFHYANYDAIEVPFSDAIPIDYDGKMGVPITFLDKYCPEQFEIIGQTQGDSGKELGLKPYPRELKKLNKSLRDGQLYYMDNGIPQKPYARILIRKKQ